MGAIDTAAIHGIGCMPDRGQHHAVNPPDRQVALQRNPTLIGYQSERGDFLNEVVI